MNIEWIYYEGVDHFGDDIKCIGERGVYNIMKEAESNNNCVAFNTLGFLKSKVDIDNLKPTAWINNNNNKGIYVKQIKTRNIPITLNNNNSNNIEIVIITLPQYSHRINPLLPLISKFKSFGLNVRFFTGIFGDDIKMFPTDDFNVQKLEYDEKTKLYNNTVRGYNKTMRKRELGCAWSHLLIYEDLLKNDNVDNYLVFEDDFELAQPMEYFIECLNQLPDDFDVCHLSKSQWYPFIFTEKVNDMYYKIMKRYINDSGAYIISKNGAKKLLDLTNGYVNVPSDDLISGAHKNDQIILYAPLHYVFVNLDVPSIVDEK